MLTRPSSTNSKKPLNSPATTTLKKPVAAKCFICNQMFHQQALFDLHMDQHQKKVNKNLPEEIQRKTAQSFGLKRKESMGKKNSTLEAINLNETKDKKLLNKTMKLPFTSVEPFQNPIATKFPQTRSSMIKKPSPKFQQIHKKQQEKRQISSSPSKTYAGDDKEIAQIDEAIKQSTMLMGQMASITERYEKQDTFFVTEDVRSDHEEEEEDYDEIIQKTVSGQEFIAEMRSNNWSLTKIEQEFLRVNFSNYQSLQNCQIQVEFLRKVSRYSDSKSLESMGKTKSKILAEVVKIIMAEENPKTYSKPQQKGRFPQQIKEEENCSPRTCSQCLDTIGFGERCIIQGDQSFHKGCFI